MKFENLLNQFNKMKKKIEQHKFLSLFLFLVVLNLFLFIAARMQWTFYYTMNDDVRMKSIITGELSGTPDGHVLFIRYMLSAILAFCYEIFPSISWYNLMLEGTIFCSLVVISYRIFRLNLTWKRLYMNTLIYIVFFVVVALKNIIYPQFTVTAGFASTAVVILLCTRRKNMRRIDILFDLLLICIFSFLGVTIRSNVFYMVIVYALVPLGIGLLIYRKGWKELLVYGSAIAVIVGVVQISEKVAYSSEEYSEYKEYNHARALVFDYLQFPEFNTNYDFYIEHDTDSVVYDLLHEYSVRIDDRISTEYLLEMQQYQNERHPKDKDKLLRLPQDMYEKCFVNSYTTIIILSFVTFSIVMLFLLVRKKQYVYACYSLVYLGMMVAETAFFVFTNRFPERVLVPMVMVGILQQYVLFSVYCHNHGLPLVTCFKGKEMRALFLVVMLTCTSWMIGMSMESIEDMKEEKQKSAKDARAYIDYAQKNKNNYYYNDAELYTGRLEVTLHENTTEIRNFMPDGGWGSGHPLLKNNLEAFDLKNMDDALTKDYVFMLSRKPLTYISNYYAYKGRIVTSKLIDTVPETTIGVYKFTEQKTKYKDEKSYEIKDEFKFENNKLEEVKSEGVLFEIEVSDPTELTLKINDKEDTKIPLYKGKNYVFSSCKNNDIITIALSGNVVGTIKQIDVY